MGATAAHSTCTAGALRGGSSMPSRGGWWAGGPSAPAAPAAVAAAASTCRSCAGRPAKTGPPSIPGLHRTSARSSAGVPLPLPLLLLSVGTAADTIPVERNPTKCCGASAPNGAPTAVTGCPCHAAPPLLLQPLPHGQGRASRCSAAAPSGVVGCSTAMWLATASMSGAGGSESLANCACGAACSCGCFHGNGSSAGSCSSWAAAAWPCRCSSQPSCQPSGPAMDGAASRRASACRSPGISATPSSRSCRAPLAAWALLAPLPAAAPLLLAASRAAWLLPALPSARMAASRAPGTRSLCWVPARLPSCRRCGGSSG